MPRASKKSSHKKGRAPTPHRSGGSKKSSRSKKATASKESKSRKGGSHSSHHHHHHHHHRSEDAPHHGGHGGENAYGGNSYEEPLYGGESTSEYDLKYGGAPPGPKGLAPKPPGPGPMPGPKGFGPKPPGPGPKPHYPPHHGHHGHHGHHRRPGYSGPGFGVGFGLGVGFGVAPAWGDYYLDPWYVRRPGWRWRHLYGSRFRFYNGLYYFYGPNGWASYAPGDLSTEIIAYELGLDPMEAAAFYGGLAVMGGESDDRYGGHMEESNPMADAIKGCAFPIRSGGEMVATAVATQTALPLALVPADLKQAGVVTVVPPAATTASAASAVAPTEYGYASKPGLPMGGESSTDVKTPYATTTATVAGGGEDDRQGGRYYGRGYGGYRGWGGRGWGGYRGWGGHYRYGNGWRFWRPNGYAYFGGVPTLLGLMALGGVWADRAYSCQWLLANGYPC